MTAERSCPHGDPTCPCQDGDACHYADVLDADGNVVSSASLCTNPTCTACGRAA